MSFGRTIKPCDAFKYWPNNYVCGKCGWPEKDHGTDATDYEVFQITNPYKDLPKMVIPKVKHKQRSKMTHLTPKKKKRK